MTGPPLSISMDFIADRPRRHDRRRQLGAGARRLCLVGADRFSAVAWLATHWLLKESAVWQDRNTDEVRSAQRDAEYAYRLAVDPPAAKELRLFGLVGWTIDRFIARRTRLHELQYEATRMREKSVVLSMVVVAVANVVVFWALANAAADGDLGLGSIVAFAMAAIGASSIAFGGLNWALDGAAAPVAAVLRLEAAMAPAGALASGSDVGRRHAGRVGHLRDGHFRLSDRGRRRARSSRTSTSRSRPGRRWRSSARTAPARRRWPSCCAGSTTRRAERSRSTASTPRARPRLMAIADHRRLPGLHPLRAVAARQRGPGGRARRGHPRRPRRGRRGRPGRRSTRSWPGATRAAPICPAGSGSASPWPGRCARCRSGAGLVLLDEPTAQLDVRGEAEIFDRILDATRTAPRS